MAVKKPGASSKKASPRKSAAKKEIGPLPANSPSLLGAEAVAQVRRLAYDLYEARGRQHGRDREDWLEAEAEVLSRLQRKESA